MEQLKVALPSRGRLRRPTLALLARAGLAVQHANNRSLISPTIDPRFLAFFVRPSDVPAIVSSGAADVGITGHDYVVESGADVVELLDLGFGKARLVVAAPTWSELRSLEDFREGTRVATKYPRIASRFFEEVGKSVKIVKVSGSVEVMPALGVADAVLDVESSGATLRLHGLEPLVKVMDTSARLIANSSALETKRGLIEELRLALKSVVDAEEKVWILMNVPERSLREVLSVLPSMAGPTLAKVEAPEPMWEVNTVVPMESVYRVILEAKKRGARDILVLHLERVIP
ncbi:MAG: ATP phosphoribosyltransferase [Fervidicoccaceae archaeon]